MWRRSHFCPNFLRQGKEANNTIFNGEGDKSFLIHGLGLIVIPENHVPEFKKKLVMYYENADIGEIRAFLKEKCWRKIR